MPSRDRWDPINNFLHQVVLHYPHSAVKFLQKLRPGDGFAGLRAAARARKAIREGGARHD
jgi:hypothetical protein